MVAMEIAMAGADSMISSDKAAFDDIFYWLTLVPAFFGYFGDD